MRGVVKLSKMISREGLYEFLAREFAGIGAGREVLTVGAGGEVGALLEEHARRNGFYITSFDIDEQSVTPRLSALALSGAIADAASGNAGGNPLMGPSSCIRRLTMARAGRPVKMLVSAVYRPASLASAARCSGFVVASGHSR